VNALLAAARTALKGCGLWRTDVTLLCAVSGGCDSVALLHTLSRLRQEMPFSLCAVHVQHGLRGDESLQDEQFVRSLCTSLNVPLTVENAGLTGDMSTLGMETLARDRRRQIFQSLTDSLPADALLTAHHRDDQAETVLMHLLRGSGMQGLCGMQTAVPFGRALAVRPFLTLGRQQLQNALDAEGLSFREDSSNQQAVTPRNALRLQIMPQLETLFPGAGEHIAQLAETLQADEACLSQKADELYHAARYVQPPLWMLDVRRLAAAPQAIRRRTVRRWYQDGLTAAGLQPDERSLSHQDTCLLDELVFQPAGSRLNLPCGLMAARENDWLHLVRQTGEALRPAADDPQTVCRERTSYALAHITLRAEPAVRLPQDACSVILPADLLEQHPVLRLPEPQDVIRPFGAPGRKPLRRWMTDRKLDPFLRPALPVLCLRNEVLWAPGLCTGEALRCRSIPENAIQLTLAGETPFTPKPPKE